MSKDTIKGTNAGSVGCPPQYLKLKRQIVTLQLEEHISNPRFTLRKMLRGAYPRLFQAVSSERGRVIASKLFEVLDIPSRGSCLHCGKPVGLNIRTLMPHRFCGANCSNKSGETAARKKETCLKKYGVDHPSKNEEVKERIATSRFLRTGSRLFNSPAAQAKARKTCLARYGFAYYTQTAEFQVKFQNTVSLRKSERPAFNYWAQKAFQNTCSRRWGGRDHPMQHPEGFKLSRKAMFAPKTFTASSGKEFSYQGYEGKVLKYLDRNPNVQSYTSLADYPLAVPYTLGGKERVYYPDLSARLTDGRKIVVEVKSKYTLQKEFEANLAKFQAAEAFFDRMRCDFWLALVDGNEIRWLKSPSRFMKQQVLK